MLISSTSKVKTHFDPEKFPKSKFSFVFSGSIGTQKKVCLKVLVTDSEGMDLIAFVKVIK